MHMAACYYEELAFYQLSECSDDKLPDMSSEG
jgi:hypothetical protein